MALQPIDTFPRDGRVVIVVGEVGGKEFRDAAQWSETTLRDDHDKLGKKVEHIRRWHGPVHDVDPSAHAKHLTHWISD